VGVATTATDKKVSVTTTGATASKDRSVSLAEIAAMFEGEFDDDGFGLVPEWSLPDAAIKGGGEGEGEADGFPGGVPASLDQLVDWLDLPGGGAPAGDKLKDDTASPGLGRYYSTFSANDEWPI